MERLIILTDLWGNRKTDWILNYSEVLKDYFELEVYDSCELGEIDLSEYSEEKIHDQFIHGGVEKAVENLLKKETSILNVLGFSVGGYIAWEGYFKGLKIDKLTAVSSTRLRVETIRPLCETNLIYGGNDSYKPESNWFKKLELDRKIYAEEEHEFYRKKEIAGAICKELIGKRKPNR